MLERMWKSKRFVRERNRNVAWNLCSYSISVETEVLRLPKKMTLVVLKHADSRIANQLCARMSVKIYRPNNLNFSRLKAISRVSGWNFIIHFEVCLIMALVTPNFEYLCDVTGLALCFCRKRSCKISQVCAGNKRSRRKQTDHCRDSHQLSGLVRGRMCYRSHWTCRKTALSSEEKHWVRGKVRKRVRGSEGSVSAHQSVCWYIIED